LARAFLSSAIEREGEIMAKKSVARKSTRGDSPALDSSDNAPMTRREIATAVAKKKKKGATKKRASKKTAKKSKKAGKKSKR
jgi:hypothetical protein